MASLAEIEFTEYFKIRTNEIDINKKIKIPALVQIMQEASMSNAIKLKVSVWDLEEKSLSWVLVKKEIIIKRLPILGESIEVTTYPSGMDRLFAYRDFIVKDASGQVIVTASSVWILMNTITRKIVAPEVKIPSPTNIEVLPRPTNKITRVVNPEIKTNFNVNWYDLDWNKHVNNVFIIKCILEGLPDERIQSGIIKKLNIQFKAESFWKDKLTSNYQTKNSCTSNHSITRDHDEKLVAQAEIEWK